MQNEEHDLYNNSTFVLQDTESARFASGELTFNESSTKQYLIHEINVALPRVAKLLNTPQEKIVVSFEGKETYFITENRDYLVSRHGTIESVPYIRRNNNSYYECGFGMALYQSRLDKDLLYVSYTLLAAYDDITVFFFKNESDSFKFFRNANRLNKIKNKSSKPPILEDGLLDSIVQDTIGFLKRKKEIEQFGVKIKRGMVLEGEPGNGKTMLCRYLLQLCVENDISWGIITSADIDSAYSETNLNALFSTFEVSFFDDIDVAYMDRSKGNGKMACSLLTAMDGMSEKSGLIRIFTTNEKIDELDKAFVRPGRIDRCVTIKKPTHDLRKKLVSEVWPKSITENINVDFLLESTDGFSFAELESIRTILVSDYIFNDKKWNLEKAINEVKLQKKINKTKKNSVGF